MKLRLQLVLISTFTLILPWAGCAYLQEMEGVLRASQQATVQSTAQAAAIALEKRPDSLQILIPEESKATRIYLTEVEQRYITDGYPDEWEENNLVAQTLENNGLKVNYSSTTNGELLWLFFKIPGDKNNWHNPSEPGIANGDHIKLITQNKYRNIYWVRHEGPGEFITLKRGRKGIVEEARIKGALRVTENGYQVELQIPLSMVGDALGFSIISNNTTVTTLDDAGNPGKIIRQSDTLSQTLNDFRSNNLKLTLVDEAGRIIATAGQLEFRSEAQEELPPGAWLLEYFYRWAMPDASEANRYPASSTGRLQRAEITRARESQQPQSTWYNSGREPPAAIISAAVPVRNPWVKNGDTAVLVAEQTTDQLLSLSNVAMTRLLALSLGTMAIIVFVLLGYASYLSLRIRRLNRAISDVMQDDGSVSGNFPKTWGTDEIGELGRRFSNLLHQVHEYNEYLRTLAAKLSHELRTPLALVKSSLDNYENDPQPKYLQRATDGSKRLSNILTAMSEAQRIEQAISSSELDTIDLNRFICEYTEHFASSQEEAIFEIDICETPIAITGSVELLAQMLDKLFSNAIDFHTPGTPIKVHLEAGNNTAVINISNQGPPLPATMGTQLFDSMVSIRNIKDEAPHLGLGLTIVRLVTEYHGGKVNAANTTNPTGVSLTVSLPCD